MTIAKERDEAFTKAVMRSDWKAVRKYCNKYQIQIPKDNRTFKAGVYKAVQGCVNIPEEVKQKAFAECVKMGFSPWVKPYEEETE